MYRLLSVLFFQHFLLDGTNILSNANPLFGGNMVKVTNFFNRDKYPFVASIAVGTGSPDKAHFCTGVLISRRHVLTAAHCRKRFSFDTRVFLGSEILENGKQYEAVSFLSYADWARAFSNNHLTNNNDEDKNVDLGIITLSKDVDKCINHVSLSNKKIAELENINAYIVGWSANKMEDNKKHKFLGRFGTLIFNQYNIRNADLLKKMQLSDPEGFIGTVAIDDVYLNEGDSGSPLFDQDNRLVAIFSEAVFRPNEPYSRSAKYININIRPYNKFINHFINDKN